MPKLAIIGTTSWGTTLGAVLAHKGLDVRLWARTEREAGALNKTDLPLLSNLDSHQLSFTSKLDEALSNVKAVIMAVPSQSMRQNIKLVSDYLIKSTIVISAAKGLEIGSNLRMSQVIADEIDSRYARNICVISGPNLAREVMLGLPAATVAAAEDEDIARSVQRLLTAPNLCVFTHNDVIGVELGGALKNIIALGAGMADGLGYGDNAKSAFMTRGLTEVTALGVAMNANPLTFSGLAGLGDLITTCASTLSRNHYVGVELTKGRPLEEITSTMEGVAEGVTTAKVAWHLAQQYGLEMPITEKIYQVLYEGKNPKEAAEELMRAEVNHELTGRKWRLFSFLKRRKRS